MVERRATSDAGTENPMITDAESLASYKTPGFIILWGSRFRLSREAGSCVCARFSHLGPHFYLRKATA